jgi:phenylpropionate dioxygenase-like ring-hydroxylating dioxygenase large terminal subunit
VNRETNPWLWYSDPEVWSLEQARIFGRSWQYVGHAGTADRPGDFFTARAGRIPIVVTHADDGETRAFVNVCRHRGSIVAEGAGNRKTLQCPYHAWTYGLDGGLRAAPRADFELDGVRLEPVRLERWGPFLFVNADADAEPLADSLGPVPAHVAELGLDVDALQFHHRAEWSVAANWKVVAENFLECYHCAVAHPGFSALVDVSPDAYRLEVGRLHSTQIGPARDRSSRSQFHFVWPNTGINVFPGEANLSIGPFVPGAPDRTDRFLDYFFGAGVSEAWISELLELDDEVGREDTALVERVQVGVSSGVSADGRLLGDAERLVAHFQGLVRDALA